MIFRNNFKYYFRDYPWSCIYICTGYSFCFRMCFNALFWVWVGDASWDVAHKSTTTRDVAHRGVRGVTSPSDLVSEQGQLDPIRSKPGVIRSDDHG